MFVQFRILELLEDGHFIKWKRLHWPRQSPCIVPHEPGPIGLQYFYVLFYTLFICVICASLVLGLEHLLSRIKITEKPTRYSKRLYDFLLSPVNFIWQKIVEFVCFLQSIGSVKQDKHLDSR